MNSKVFLETDRFYLTKVDKEHCNDQYLGWLHDKDVNKFLETGKVPTNIKELLSYVNNVKALLFLAIHEKGSNIYLGNIKIDVMNTVHRTAEYGILIGNKSYWGKGVAEEISRVVIDHCFKVLNVRKITLGVIEDNKGASRLYDKLGFLEEGVYKNHVFVNGKYLDIRRMAVFQKDWLNVVE